MRTIIRYACILTGLAIFVTLSTSCKKKVDPETAAQAAFAKKETDSINREIQGIDPRLIRFFRQLKTIYYLSNAMDPEESTSNAYAEGSGYYSSTYFPLEEIVRNFGKHSLRWYYNQPLWTRAVVLNRAIVGKLRDIDDDINKGIASNDAAWYQQKYDERKKKLQAAGVDFELTIADLPEISSTTKELPINWIFNGVALPNDIDIERVLE